MRALEEKGVKNLEPFGHCKNEKELRGCLSNVLHDFYLEQSWDETKSFVNYDFKKNQKSNFGFKNLPIKIQDLIVWNGYNFFVFFWILPCH